MQRVRTILITACGIAALAAPALAQSRDQSPGTDEAARTELHSEHAALAGDWATVTALSGRSYRLSPSLTNEFNLATAYARAGQTALAVPLYEDVVENGQYTLGAGLYPNGGGGRDQPARFNLADEATRRLAVLSGEAVVTAGLK